MKAIFFLLSIGVAQLSIAASDFQKTDKKKIEFSRLIGYNKSMPLFAGLDSSIYCFSHDSISLYKNAVTGKVPLFANSNGILYGFKGGFSVFPNDKSGEREYRLNTDPCLYMACATPNFDAIFYIINDGKEFEDIRLFFPNSKEQKEGVKLMYEEFFITSIGLFYCTPDAIVEGNYDVKSLFVNKEGISAKKSRKIDSSFLNLLYVDPSGDIYIAIIGFNDGSIIYSIKNKKCSKKIIIEGSGYKIWFQDEKFLYCLNPIDLKILKKVEIAKLCN